MVSRTAAGPRIRPRGASLSQAERLKRLDRLARIMDAAIAIPGTRISLGADALVGLVPGAGDLIAKAASAYILYEAHQMGVPKYKLLRMAAMFWSTSSSASCRSRAMSSTSSGGRTSAT